MRRLSHIVLLILVIAAAAPEATPADNPEALGPYAIGVTTMLLEDHAREALVGTGPRTLMTEVWYPAAEETRGLPKVELLSFFRGIQPGLVAGLMKMAFGADLLAVNKTIQLAAVRDARMAEGKFPLLLFSHGNGGMRSQALFWCEHMASHGYIVVAPDHTGNAGATIIDGKLIPIDDKLREASAEARPRDISFLIDVFARFNKGADSRFYQRVDIEQIGVAGHSFGGYTATRTADLDPRVDAIAPWAAVGRERDDYDTPLLMLIATEDDTIGLDGNERMRNYFAESRGPKYLVEFVNAGHYSFTEMYRWNPEFGDGVGAGTRITNGEAIEYIGQEEAFRLTNGYNTAFFGKFLKGIADYDAYLTTNQSQEQVILKTE
jgi:dienelactone hydrolase